MIIRTFPIALLASVAGAQASDYQWELSGSYSHGDDTVVSRDTASLTGTYYVAPVQARSHPLAEAGFLERASNVSLTQTRNNVSSEDATFRSGDRYYTVLGSDSTSDVASLNAEWYLPGELFYLGAGISHRRTDFSDGSRNDTLWDAAFGITPADGLLVYSRLQDLGDAGNLNARYVTDHFGPTIAAEAGYDYYRGLENDRLSVSLDYYFSRTLSVGYQRTEWLGSGSNGTNGNRFNIKKFFGDQWSLTGFYSNPDYLGEWGLEASLRF